MTNEIKKQELPQVPSVDPKKNAIRKSLIIDYPGIPPEQLIKIENQLAPLNLPLNKALGLVNIIPYGNNYQVQVSVKGYATILYANKAVKKIDQIIVYNGMKIKRDKWTRICGVQGSKKDNIVIGYLAVATLPDNTEMAFYMTKTEANEYRKKYSKAKNSPWDSEFDKMALKSVVKQLIRQLPLVQSTDLIAAMNYDQSVFNRESEVWEYQDNPKNEKAKVEIVNDYNNDYSDIEWDEQNNEI